MFGFGYQKANLSGMINQQHLELSCRDSRRYFFPKVKVNITIFEVKLHMQVSSLCNLRSFFLIVRKNRANV